MTVVSLPSPLWQNGTLILFHGTLEQHAASVLNGIDLSKVRGFRDFGRGFYTTTDFEQAASWADHLVRRRGAGNTPAIIEFQVDRDLLARLDCLCFVRGDRLAADFWSVVTHCRRLDRHHGRQVNDGWYDLVVGPVSADWEQRMIVQNSDQLSFHTERAVQLLDASRPRRVT